MCNLFKGVNLYMIMLKSLEYFVEIIMISSTACKMLYTLPIYSQNASHDVQNENHLN